MSLFKQKGGYLVYDGLKDVIMLANSKRLNVS